MREEVFHFKCFDVRHGKGSMKVGVDAVLIGAWSGKRPLKILDVGTGCGVISLMLAQRFPEAQITGIDIDRPSLEEASENFARSLWSSNLKTVYAEFPKDLNIFQEKFDLIISNPPYFNSGIAHPLSQREKARHQDSLSVFSLIENANDLLDEEGCLSMIFPYEFLDRVQQKVNEKRLKTQRICMIKDREERPVKRVMIEIGYPEERETEMTNLTLFENDKPTEAYRKLCHDFYLKF